MVCSRELPFSLVNGRGPSPWFRNEGVWGCPEGNRIGRTNVAFRCQIPVQVQGVSTFFSPCHPYKQLTGGKGRHHDRATHLWVRTPPPQETSADGRAWNPRNAVESRSSPGPRDEGYALQAGQPRAVDPMGGELAEGTPPGWGRIAPRAGAGCGGERGSRGSWRRWGLTSDFALPLAGVAGRVLRERPGARQRTGSGCG